MKIFKSYLKKQATIILIVFFTHILILFLTTKLYNIPYEPIIYPMFLGFLCLLIYYIYDYIEFSRKYQFLEKLKENTNLEIAEINKKNDIVENLYIDIIKLKNLENKKIIDKNESETNEIIDYYTMWVHQIKNPIAALGFLIDEENSKNKKQEEIELFKIEQYVNMVLSYLRLDSDKNDLVLEKINVEESINNVLKKYAPLFFSKKLRIDYKGLDLTIVSDKKWLEFILEQIISNAIKYSKNGGFLKIYKLKNAIVIEDRGIGIAADNLPRIFDKGYTGFNGRYEKKSSGLGLYLAKKVADNLGFDIKIQSEIHRGTRVKIVIEKSTIV